VAGHRRTSGTGPEASTQAAFAITDRPGSPRAPLSEAGRALHARFVAAIDDDLDMPAALRIVRETLRASLPAEERRWLVLDFDFVLGLDLDRAGPTGAVGADVAGTAGSGLPGGAEALLAARGTARSARDFATSDRLRDELRALGVEVSDHADGSTDARRATPTERP
jgi:cysteinyl-tRNA synthetase